MHFELESIYLQIPCGLLTTLIKNNYQTLYTKNEIL